MKKPNTISILFFTLFVSVAVHAANPADTQNSTNVGKQNSALDIQQALQNGRRNGNGQSSILNKPVTAGQIHRLSLPQGLSNKKPKHALSNKPQQETRNRLDTGKKEDMPMIYFTPGSKKGYGHSENP